MHIHPRVGRVQLTATLAAIVAAIVGFANHPRWWAILILFAAVLVLGGQALRFGVGHHFCTCPITIEILRRQLADAAAREVELLKAANRTSAAARELRRRSGR